MPTPTSRTVAQALESWPGRCTSPLSATKNYEALGFSPSPGTIANGVQMPDGAAYFTSRGSVMGQVPGEVVAAAFAVFNPQAVIPAVTLGWTRTDADTICHARTVGARAELIRILGDRPTGLARRHRVAGPGHGRPHARRATALRRARASLGLPGDPMGDMWRLADLLREYRGDSHTAAWASTGLTAPEIGLLSELYWGLPMKNVRADPGLVGPAARRSARGTLFNRGLIAEDAFSARGASCGSRLRWPPTDNARSSSSPSVMTWPN